MTKKSIHFLCFVYKELFCLKVTVVLYLKGAMSRIARLLSHYSFGAKNSLKSQKKLLIKRVNRGLLAPSRFPTNTKTTNCVINEVCVRLYYPYWQYTRPFLYFNLLISLPPRSSLFQIPNPKSKRTLSLVIEI